jgi:hypothetical protein
VLDEFIALDFVDHTSQVRGRENAKHELIKWLKNYPDLHMTIEESFIIQRHFKPNIRHNIPQY